MTNADEHKAGGMGLLDFLSGLNPASKGVLCFMFAFTIWSVFTGFDLGTTMNKYADASIEQNAMQFQAQLEMQKMQFQATESSNDKLDTLILSVDSVNERMAQQAGRIAELANRMNAVETTVGRVAKWTCKHEGKDAPSYCAAMVKGEL